MDCPSYIFTFCPKKEKVIINEEKKEKKVNWFIGDSKEIFSLKKEFINKEKNKYN